MNDETEASILAQKEGPVTLDSAMKRVAIAEEAARTASNELTNAQDSFACAMDELNRAYDLLRATRKIDALVGEENIEDGT